MHEVSNDGDHLNKKRLNLAETNKNKNWNNKIFLDGVNWYLNLLLIIIKRLIF